MNAPEYLTPTQLAEQWLTTAETVIAHIKVGRLRAFTLSPPGSRRPRWRIPMEAISEFEERQCVSLVKQNQNRNRNSEPDVIQYFRRGERVG